MKYLGLFIDDKFSWKKQIKELSTKLSKTNRILSKLRHCFKIYISISNILFSSNLQSDGLESHYSIRLGNNVLELQNFCSNKLIKFYDIVWTNQVLFGYQFINKTLPKDILDLFIQNSNIHDYNSRSNSNHALHIPMIISSNYGKQSLRYMIPYVFNQFFRHHSQLSNDRPLTSPKRYIKLSHLDKYKSEFD